MLLKDPGSRENRMVWGDIMGDEKTDMLSDVWTWLAHAMGAEEGPGKRVVNPDAKTIKETDEHPSVPKQARRDVGRPHDAQ